MGFRLLASQSCRRGLIVSMFAVAAAAGGYAASASAATVRVVCSLYASPTGSDATGDGSSSSSFRTAQRLVSSLRPGQTGCLNAGTYSAGTYGVNGLVFPRGNVTLTSAPGQAEATISGGDYFVYVPNGSDDVTIENLHINMAHNVPAQVSVQIAAAHTALINDDITNENSRATCIILGSNGGYGQAVQTVIRGNVIHQCGSIADGNQDHAIYFENSLNGTITDNVFWGTSAFAIHLYDNAQGNRITHNVIDDNGYGVTFGGDSSFRSNNNEVAYNIVTDSTIGYGAQSYWGGRTGAGNRFDHNCLYGNAHGDIEDPTTGYTSSRNLVANPDFTNPAKHDYRLRQASPCLPIVGYDTAVQVQSRAADVPVRHPRRRRTAGSAAGSRLRGR